MSTHNCYVGCSVLDCFFKNKSFINKNKILYFNKNKIYIYNDSTSIITSEYSENDSVNDQKVNYLKLLVKYLKLKVLD